MGKFTPEPLLPQKSYYRYIGKDADYPENYKMSASGVFLRESVLDIPQMESIFVTPRAFNFYMSRKSSEEWEKEQLKDSNGQPPINLYKIEQGVAIQNMHKMAIYENGKADYRKISDTELCSQIDALARNKYGKRSVYQLSLAEKRELAEYFYLRHHPSESQIRRCLVLL